MIAVTVGGIWAYKKFVMRREEYPFAEMQHEINHFILNDEYILLTVKIKLKNCGNVLIELKSGWVYVQQIIPPTMKIREALKSTKIKDLRFGKHPSIFFDSNRLVAFGLIGRRDLAFEKGNSLIEPGETDEFQIDFILAKDVETIRLKSYFKNIKLDEEVGWQFTSFYSIKE